MALTEAGKRKPWGSPVDNENETDRRGRRFHTGQISEAAEHAPWGSPVDQENKASCSPATEDGLSNPSLRSPRTDTSALLVKMTRGGVGPTPVKFSKQGNESLLVRLETLDL